MAPIPPYQPGQSISDYVVSVLRTVVPVAWGALITYLISLVPGVAPALAPAQPVIAGWGVAIAAAVTAAWYALMRKIEPKLPQWLAVIVLGSSQMPTYVPSAQGPSAQLDRAVRSGLSGLADTLSGNDQTTRGGTPPASRPPSADL